MTYRNPYTERVNLGANFYRWAAERFGQLTPEAANGYGGGGNNNSGDGGNGGNEGNGGNDAPPAEAGSLCNDAPPAEAGSLCNDQVMAPQEIIQEMIIEVLSSPMADSEED